MTISFGSKTTTPAVGSTSLSVAYPSSISAGDLLVLCISNKYDPNYPSTPSGWTYVTTYWGSNGASGTDAGSACASVFYKVASGSESGSLAVTITSGNSAIGVILRFTKTSGNWSVSYTGGYDSTVGTDWSISGGSLYTDSLVKYLVVSSINSDAATFTSEALTQTGVTFATGTEHYDTGTTTNDDCALVVWEQGITSGSGSGSISYAMTASGSKNNYPAGGTLILRLAETLVKSVTGAGGVKAGGVAVTDELGVAPVILGWQVRVSGSAITSQYDAPVIRNVTGSGGMKVTGINLIPVGKAQISGIKLSVPLYSPPDGKYIGYGNLVCGGSASYELKDVQEYVSVGGIKIYGKVKGTGIYLRPTLGRYVLKPISKFTPRIAYPEYFSQYSGIEAENYIPIISGGIKLSGAATLLKKLSNRNYI
jgi:hypothetical protein